MNWTSSRIRRPWSPVVLLALLLPGGCVTGRDRAATAPEPPSRRSGSLRVSYLDVGQGDAALVETPDAAVLIDGGPSEAGPRVLDALRAAGIRRLQWVVGSHPHEDHIGGLIDVMREIPADRALDPGYIHGTATQRRYLALLRDRETQVQRARAGQALDLGSGARLEILAPGAVPITGTESDANNNSIVARLVFGDTSFLFTGDMEQAERERLLETSEPAALRADVLKVAHHGSHDGTDAGFLRAVRPRYAVISAAAGNEYGHPHAETLSALAAADCRVLRTDREGTIRFESDGSRLAVTVERAASGSSGTTEGQAAEAPGPVIGNRGSRVYHAPGCDSLPRPDNRAAFADGAAARDAGYRPHASCTRR